MSLEKITQKIKEVHYYLKQDGIYGALLSSSVVVVGLTFVMNLTPSDQEQQRQQRIQEQVNYLIKTYDLDSNGVIDTSEVRKVAEQSYTH